MTPRARAPLRETTNEATPRPRKALAIEALAASRDDERMMRADATRGHERGRDARGAESDALARESVARTSDDARAMDARADARVGTWVDGEKYAETVALLRAHTEATLEARARAEALEEALEEARCEREKVEVNAGRVVREARGEVDATRRTLEEVVESRARARESAARESERARALESELEREREDRRREVEALRAELGLARERAENASRVSVTKSGVEVTAELYEKSHASEKKALKEAQLARNALVEQKKTLEAMEKRLRETRSRADLAEAKCRELKSAQKRWDRLESNGDAAFANSPAPSTTPRTLRQSHRDVRAYAAHRVETLEKDVKSTKSEATLAAAELDSKLAAESGARGAVQGALDTARARIRVLENERDVLRARAEAAEGEVEELKMSLRLAVERASQAEETAAREIANAMDAFDRVRFAEDALGEAEQDHEAKLKEKSAMKRREFGAQVRELEERLRNVELERDIARQRSLDADAARRALEVELERAKASVEPGFEARVREAESRAERAEEELNNYLKAALSGRKSASEALSPSPSHTENSRKPSTVIQASSFRLAKPTPRQARIVAANLMEGLREKLDASSPSWTRKTQSRTPLSDDQSFTTPTKRATV